MNEKTENKLNGRFYSIWMKALVIFLAVLMALMAGTGVFVIADSLQAFTFQEAWDGTEYAKSKQHIALMSEELTELISEKINASKFLKDGEFDPEKTVDIMNLDEGIDGTDKNDDTSYKLGNLVKFHQSENYTALQSLIYFCEEDLDLWEQTEYASDNLNYFYLGDDGTLYGVDSFTTEDLTDCNSLTEEGILYIVDKDGIRSYEAGKDKNQSCTRIGRDEFWARTLNISDSETDISDNYGIYGETFCFLYEKGKPLETYLPVSGTSIADHALENAYYFSILDAYKNLLTAADCAYSAYINADNSSNMKEELDETQSSYNVSNITDLVLYIYSDSVNGDSYTNNPAWNGNSCDQVMELLQNSESFRNYPYFMCILYGSSSKLETCEGLSEEALATLKTNSSEFPVSKRGYFTVTAVWNPAVSQNDPFASGESMNLTKWFRPAVFVTVIGGLLFLALLACSLIQAGRRYGDMNYAEDGTKIRRAGVFIRRCPICVLIGIDFLGFGLWMALLLGLVRRIFSIFNAACSGIVGVLGVLLLFWILLTFVIKLKSHNLLTNSLICLFVGAVIKLVKRGWSNLDVLARLLAIYAGLSVIGIIGVFMLKCGESAGCFVMIIPWGILLFLLCNKAIERKQLTKDIHELASGNLEHQINVAGLSGTELAVARELNDLENGMQQAVNDQMKSERMKTDLITNVSHDIKTPLTSIINYVDLLKRENLNNEKAEGYLKILDQKSARLKQLTEDLVEASKTSSGNIVLECINLDLKQLILQTNGEFSEKFEKRNLEMICSLPEEPMVIYADGRRVFRILENLYNNAAKYAMAGSRVYIKGENTDEGIVFSMKNISEQSLNYSAEELMERFVRGDVSRTTEGSGLGLEIARNLTTIQHGTFDLYVDGDFFKVTITWPPVRN